MSHAQPTREAVTSVLREVIDPEVGLDVVALGLVYGVTLDGGRVQVALTMTTPACPLGEHIAEDARARLARLPGVEQVAVELVWEPPWDPSRMSEEARRTLGWKQ